MLCDPHQVTRDYFLIRNTAVGQEITTCHPVHRSTRQRAQFGAGAGPPPPSSPDDGPPGPATAEGLPRGRGGVPAPPAPPPSPGRPGASPWRRGPAQPYVRRPRRRESRGGRAAAMELPAVNLKVGAAGPSSFPGGEGPLRPPARARRGGGAGSCAAPAETPP